MKAFFSFGGSCNNNCFFCSKRFERAGTETIKAGLKKLRAEGASELFVSGGEPALGPALFSFVSSAKKEGFEQVSVCTNGRMLSYSDFAAELKGAGCNAVGVSLFSHVESVHDGITRVPNSWKQAVKGIENAQKNGLGVSVTVPVLPQNVECLPETVEFLVQLGVKKVALNCAENNCGQETGFRLSYSESLPAISKCLDLEEKTQIALEGIPPCLIDFSTDHLDWKLGVLNAKRGRILDSCRDCRFVASCPGIPKKYLEKHGSKEFVPVKARLLEVKLEVTPRCNGDCAYCYNRYSFATGKTRPSEEVETGKWERVIAEVAKRKIPLIKFTGGEPLLRKDIGHLMAFAKKLGLFVVLNTNGLLLPEKFEDIKKNAGMVILSFQSVRPQDAGKSFSARAMRGLGRHISELKNYGVSVRANTIATRENIAKLGEFRSIVLELGFGHWSLLRPLSRRKSERLNNSDVARLVEKLEEFKKAGGVRCFLEHAIPFCACDPQSVMDVSEAYKFSMNNQAFTIDPFGMAKPSSMLHLDLGNVFSGSIEKIWGHPFVKAQQSLEILPQACKKCNYVGVCRGGSREQAFIATGRLDAMDPLARPHLHKRELFRKR